MSILSFLTTYSGSAAAQAAPIATGAIPDSAGFEVVTDAGIVRASVAQVSALLLPSIFSAITNVTPTELPAASIYQRMTRTGGTYGQGAASVTFNIMVSIAGLPLFFRLRDATAAGNPILIGSGMALAATTAGTQTVSISVPSGPYWYLVDWCAGTSGAWVLGAHKIGVGEVLAVAGQSLGDRLMHDFSGVSMASIGLTPPILPQRVHDLADSGGSGVVPGAVSWGAVADGLPLDSAFAPQLAQRFLSASGVPVAVIGYTHGGTSMRAGNLASPITWR